MFGFLGDGVDEGGGFDAGFDFFFLGDGVEEEGGAGADGGDLVLEVDGSDGDAGVELVFEIEETDASAIPSAGRVFEVFDGLHGDGFG